MYALIVPASAPLVLLATVLGLSWWEDHVLPSPPTDPTEAAIEIPFASAAYDAQAAKRELGERVADTAPLRKSR